MSDPPTLFYAIVSLSDETGGLSLPADSPNNLFFASLAALCPAFPRSATRFRPLDAKKMTANWRSPSYSIFLKHSPDDGDTSAEGLRATFKWHGHDPKQERWVVTAPDAPDNFIAHAWVFAQSQEWVVTLVRVHPAWRRQGLGSALLAQTLGRARQVGANHVTGGCWQTVPQAHDFLIHHGFEPVGHNRFFAAPADVPLPASVWPDGYTVRAFAEVQNLALLAAVCNRCYHDMWGHAENVPGAVDEARLAEGMRNSPTHYNHDSIFIAFAPDGEAVGVCFGRIYGHENNDPTMGRPKQVVDSPGVAPQYRHLGLQRPLTLITMHWLRKTIGAGPIQLHTYGDHEAAVAIYHALGFVVEPNSHLIEHRLALVNELHPCLF